MFLYRGQRGVACSLYSFLLWLTVNPSNLVSYVYLPAFVWGTLENNWGTQDSIVWNNKPQVKLSAWCLCTEAENQGLKRRVVFTSYQIKPTSRCFRVSNHKKAVWQQSMCALQWSPRRNSNMVDPGEFNLDIDIYVQCLQDPPFFVTSWMPLRLIVSSQ